MLSLCCFEISKKFIFHFEDKGCNYGNLLTIRNRFQMSQRSLENAKAKRMFRPNTHLFCVQITQSDWDRLPERAHLSKFRFFCLRQFKSDFLTEARDWNFGKWQVFGNSNLGSYLLHQKVNINCWRASLNAKSRFKLIFYDTSRWLCTRPLNQISLLHFSHSIFLIEYIRRTVHLKSSLIFVFRVK